MAYLSLRDFIHRLEHENELVRIKQPISTYLEMTEITDRISKSEGGGKALLFENTGSQFPVLLNAYGSERRMALALGASDLNTIGEEIERLFKLLASPRKGLFDKLKLLPQLADIGSWMPKSISGRGKCQEIIQTKPDLSLLPILHCWPADGGRFITLPCVVTRDPETGLRNVGMYRLQVFESDLTGMHWHKHKTGARHFEIYKKLGKRMPVSVVLGGDPAYTYAATAPLPENIDEYLLAGFLRKRKVELVKCLTNELEVPADADFIIEGYVDPEEDLIWEGPFGDHTGFYSLADWYPKFHVTCITHRRDAVYPATIVGIPPQEDAWIGRATERIFLAPMKLTMIPELINMDLPPAGVAHNLTLVQISKTFAGQALKVMNAMWGAGQMMFNKVLIVADQTIEVNDYPQFFHWAINHLNPLTDVHFSRGPMDVLDHSSSQFAYGSKLGFDLTTKFPEETTSNQLSVIGLVDHDLNEIKQVVESFDAVILTDLSLLNKGYPVVLAGIRKQHPSCLADLIRQIGQHESLGRIKLWVFVDPELDLSDLFSVCWYVTGNIDPTRDCHVVPVVGKPDIGQLFVDGTRKSGQVDDFKREWPNPVTASPETIQKVDHLWDGLNLGELLPSPSLKYIPLKKGEGAVSDPSI